MGMTIGQKLSTPQAPAKLANDDRYRTYELTNNQTSYAAGTPDAQDPRWIVWDHEAARYMADRNGDTSWDNFNDARDLEMELRGVPDTTT